MVLSANYFYTRLVWHWNEKCGLCTKLNWRFPPSLLYPCVRPSTSAPGGSVGLWLKWFLLCQVKHSKKPVTRKPQCSLALCTPHMLPKLAWMAGVIRGDGGETGVEGSRLCLFIKGDVLLKLRFFIALREGNVWVITLCIPVAGPSMRASASKCGRPHSHLKSLCWSSVYFQVCRRLC